MNHLTGLHGGLEAGAVVTGLAVTRADARHPIGNLSGARIGYLCVGDGFRPSPTNNVAPSQ